MHYRWIYKWWSGIYKKVLYYSSSVPARTSTVSLTPTAEHENIIIKINDEVVESGKQYRVDLNSGINKILIVTTSIIDNSQLTYVIEVTRGYTVVKYWLLSYNY